MNTLHALVFVAAGLLLWGCGNTPSDADYGESVRRMIEAQTFDLAAASNPPALAPELTDGARLQNALEVYRKDVAKGATEVKQPVVFEIGSN